MNLTTPLTDISPSLHGHVLTVLALADEPLTGRGVTARMRIPASHAGVQKVLNALVASGLVHRRDHPPAALYAINREHLAAPPVIDFTELREELLRRIGGLVKSWQFPPVSVCLFGSAARGDAGPGSDVDVLILRSNDVPEDHAVWSRQRVELAEAVLSWTGNEAGTVEFSLNQFWNAYLAGEKLLDDLLREGILITGRPIRPLLRQLGRENKEEGDQ